MDIFIQLNDNDRIIGYGSTRGTENDIEIEVADDHDVLKNPFIFKFVNGGLVRDDEYQQQLIQEKEERINRQTLEQKYELMQKALDDLILGGM